MLVTVTSALKLDPEHNVAGVVAASAVTLGKGITVTGQLAGAVGN